MSPWPIKNRRTAGRFYDIMTSGQSGSPHFPLLRTLAHDFPLVVSYDVSIARWQGCDYHLSSRPHVQAEDGYPTSHQALEKAAMASADLDPEDPDKARPLLVRLLEEGDYR